MRARPGGYIFVETVVAMGILSMSALVIQNAIREAILTRGQAEDYTTARFLLEQVAGEQAIKFQQPEGQGSGRFDAPFDRFSYEWRLQRVDVPRPELPPHMTPQEREWFEKAFLDYMGKLTVKITWSRAGMELQTVGETLLRPELLWLPEAER